MNDIKKIKIGTVAKQDIVFIIGTRFITIGCVLNKTFRIVYDQEKKEFINSCKYCSKQCKVKKIINRYIKRGNPFNFDDLIVKPQKRKKKRKIRIKKI